jgi:hypothetical protein
LGAPAADLLLTLRGSVGGVCAETATEPQSASSRANGSNLKDIGLSDNELQINYGLVHRFSLWRDAVSRLTRIQDLVVTEKNICRLSARPARLKKLPKKPLTVKALLNVSPEIGRRADSSSITRRRAR